MLFNIVKYLTLSVNICLVFMFIQFPFSAISTYQVFTTKPKSHKEHAGDCLYGRLARQTDVLMLNAQNSNKFRFQIKYFVCNENVLKRVSTSFAGLSWGVGSDALVLPLCVIFLKFARLCSRRT